MNLRNNRGFTGIDVSVALVIIVLFAGLVASLVYKFGIASKEIDRKSEATYLAIQVIEGIKQMDYQDIIEDTAGGMTVQNIESSTGQTIENEDGYTITINVQNYKDKMQNDTLEDVMKIVKVTVEYTVETETQNVDVSTVVTKEE